MEDAFGQPTAIGYLIVGIPFLIASVAFFAADIIRGWVGGIWIGFMLLVPAIMLIAAGVS